MPHDALPSGQLSHSETIVRGRALVRLIEAADVLIASAMSDSEMDVQTRARDVCRSHLRAIIANLPAHIGAEILAVSEKIHGPVGEVSLN
jgi:hypothetical protein